MRPLIFIRSERIDLDQYEDQVAQIRNSFDCYLEEYHVKTARTKAGLMGPVGKLLSEARSGRWDAESLTGYALNIHLMNPKSHDFIAPEARVALQEGVASLVGLMAAVPPAAQDRLLERIDYGVYWLRRRKGLEYMDSVRSQFGEFLKKRYPDIARLNQSWELKAARALKSFDQVPFPSKRTEKGNERFKTDIMDYWAELKDEPAEAEQEGEA